jgi:hypothetical protein
MPTRKEGTCPSLEALSLIETSALVSRAQEKSKISLACGEGAV